MRRFAVSTTVLLSAALGALGWAMQFSPISNQILGLMLYIIAGLLALLAIARWQWVVRKRTQYGVTFMSIAIVGLIGAIAGAIIAATLYLLSPYLVEPRDEAKESRARVEFLLEAAKPLKQVALIIDLKQALTPDALEHFRALVTISNMNVSAQYPNPTERDDPHPALCVGGRDHYPVADLGGTKQKWFGVQHLVYALNPSDEMQNTLFSMSQPTSSRIEFSGGLYGKGPFKTIGDLDDRYVNVYITEPLLQHIAAIHFVANSYLLFSEPVANVARVNGSPLAEWPGALDSKEQGVPWITLMLKGADYARYETEGESPHWFPFNLYRPWILPFDGYTPGRL